MYRLVRLIIAIVFFVCLFIFWIHKTKGAHKIKLMFFTFVFSYLLFNILLMLPFEGLFFKFDTAESVAAYCKEPHSSEEYFVVEGEETGIMCFTQGTSYTVEKLIRSGQGWKKKLSLSTGVSTFSYYSYVNVNIINCSDDYYLLFLSLDSNLELIDGYETEFKKFITKEISSGETIYYYYAPMPKIDENEYKIAINGKQVSLDPDSIFSYNWTKEDLSIKE